MQQEYRYSQDGADFYLNEGETLVAVVTYPQGVRDFDLPAAQRACEWFKKLMHQWNIEVYREEV